MVEDTAANPPSNNPKAEETKEVEQVQDAQKIYSIESILFNC